MADQRALLEIVASVDKAVSQFNAFEKKYVTMTKRLDAASDKVDFDVTSKSAIRLQNEMEKARKGMVRSANQATKEFKELGATNRVTGEGFQAMARDVRKVEAAAKAAGAATDKAGKKTAKSLAAARAKAEGLRKSMASLKTTVAGLGLTFAFTAAIRAMSAFEKTMDAVLAVTSATEEEFAALNETAVNLGEATIFSATQVAKGMELMGRAGFETNQIIAAMPGLLELAAAGQLDLATATDIASNTLRGFGLVAEEMNRVSDVLAITAASTNTNIQQLGEGLKFVAPVAASAGISLEETAAAMGTLSNAGLQGSLAGTGLRRVLSALAQGGPNVAKAMRGLGISMEQVNPATQKLGDIIQLLADRSISLNTAFQAFGQRGAPAILVLTRRAKDLAELTGVIDAAEGAAKKMSDTMQDNMVGAFKKVVSAAEGFTIKTGNRGVAGALKNLLEIIALVVRGLDPLVTLVQGVASGVFTAFAATITGVVSALQTLLRVSGKIADVLPGFDGLRDKFVEAADAVEVANDFMVDFTENLAADTIGTLKQAGDGFTSLVKAGKSLGELEGEIKGSFKAVTDYIDEVGKAGKITGDQAKKIVKDTSAVLNLIRELPESARAGYGEMVKELKKLREANRQVVDSQELSIEAMAKQLAIMEETAKETRNFVSAVRGSREELEIRTAAIVDGVIELKESGRITQETVEAVGKKVAELTEEWVKFGEAAPPALKALVKEFPAVASGADRVGKASRGAAQGIDELTGSAKALFDEVEARKKAIEDLGSDIEGLQKTIAELNQKQAEGSLSQEELQQLFNAQDLLAQKQFEFGRATKNVVETQQQYIETGHKVIEVNEQQAKSAREMIDGLKQGAGQLALGDALEFVDTQSAQDAAAAMDTGFEIMSAAIERYTSVVHPAGVATGDTAVALEKAADGTIQMTSGLKEGQVYWDGATQTMKQFAVAAKDSADGLVESGGAVAQAGISFQQAADGSLIMTNALEGAKEAAEGAAAAIEDQGKAAVKTADQAAAAAERTTSLLLDQVLAELGIERAHKDVAKAVTDTTAEIEAQGEAATKAGQLAVEASDLTITSLLDQALAQRGVTRASEDIGKATTDNTAALKEQGEAGAEAGRKITEATDFATLSLEKQALAAERGITRSVGGVTQYAEEMGKVAAEVETATAAEEQLTTRIEGAAEAFLAQKAAAKEAQAAIEESAGGGFEEAAGAIADVSEEVNEITDAATAAEAALALGSGAAVEFGEKLRQAAAEAANLREQQQAPTDAPDQIEAREIDQQPIIDAEGRVQGIVEVTSAAEAALILAADGAVVFGEEVTKAADDGTAALERQGAALDGVKSGLSEGAPSSLAEYAAQYNNVSQAQEKVGEGAASVADATDQTTTSLAQQVETTEELTDSVDKAVTSTEKLAEAEDVVTESSEQATVALDETGDAAQDIQPGPGLTELGDGLGNVVDNAGDATQALGGANDAAQQAEGGVAGLAEQVALLEQALKGIAVEGSAQFDQLTNSIHGTKAACEELKACMSDV